MGKENYKNPVRLLFSCYATHVIPLAREVNKTHCCDTRQKKGLQEDSKQKIT